MEMKIDFNLNSGISDMIHLYPEEISSFEIENNTLIILTDGINMGKRRIYIPSKHINLNMLNNLTFKNWRIIDNVLSLTYGEQHTLNTNSVLLHS